MTGKILENRETRNTPHIYDLAKCYHIISHVCVHIQSVCVMKYLFSDL